MPAEGRKLVCLTPVRNEAWVLDRFLSCASTWADIIIVLDQQSTDGSAEIARRHKKVHLVEWERTEFDEAERRALLVDLARSLVTEPRVLVSLDADEVIACDAWDQPEMRRFLAGPPGTRALMRWINVLPDEPRGWIPPGLSDFMFIDDGRGFRGEAIHGPRLPRVDDSGSITLEGPKVIHLQYLDKARMKSKQRWYQALERVEYPDKRPIQIYRQYHLMDAISPAERHELRPEWYRPHELAFGLDLFASAPRAAYSTDGRVMDLFERCGADRFRRVDLWDGGWESRAAELQRPLPAGLAQDPHNAIERAVFAWLARTQTSLLEPRIRWVQRALRLAGW